MIKRSVITIAVGKPYYHGLARNLVLSFQLWNKENEIHFLLLTDKPEFYTEFKNNPRIHISLMAIDEADKSFTSKFKMFDYAIAEENIFIDCDCLIYKNISFIFDSFTGKSFSAIGNNISEGNFFCDVPHIIQKFGIPSMPKFVGCVYYFKKNAVAESIFKKAIELKSVYDETGFVRLNNKENEEPLFAVAMAINGESLIPNTGQIKADLMYFKNVFSDVLSGKAAASSPVRLITGGEIVQEKAMPAILHFNGSFTDEYIYESEGFRLKNWKNSYLSVRLRSWVKFILPGQLKKGTKNMLRPIFRVLFGYRKINKKDRNA